MKEGFWPRLQIPDSQNDCSCQGCCFQEPESNRIWLPIFILFFSMLAINEQSHFLSFTDLRGNAWTCTSCHEAWEFHEKTVCSSLLLISYEPLVLCVLLTASGLRMSSQKYLYYNIRGAKLMKCLFNSQYSSAAQAEGQWHCYAGYFLRRDSGVRVFTLTQCTFVVAPHKRAIHHVKCGNVQWKSIMLWSTCSIG